MNEKPLVSIIIVNYNGKPLLEQCLSSLMKIDYPKFEIILVDNNSTDDSLEFVKNNFPSVIILKLSKNFGFAEPNNMGAKIAKGEFLLFLNNDTIVTSNFITELVQAALQDKQIAILQSLLLKSEKEVDSSGDFIDVLGRAYSSKVIPVGVKPILSARGASMMVRKDAFWKLGGFDKKFYVSFEDIDLGWRAWIWGYKVVLVPDSIVYHKVGATVNKIRPQIRFHGVKNELILNMTNFELDYMIKSLFLLLFDILTKKISGKKEINNLETYYPLPSYKSFFQGLIWVIKNYKYIREKRKLVNSRRVLGTRKLKEMGLIIDTKK